MRVKKVPLQDLELWPDEVICFTAYTDTRNPVQQRRTYVDGEKLKAENAELRADLQASEHVINQIANAGFEANSENEKLRDLAKYAIICSEGDALCEGCPYHTTEDGHIVCTIRKAAAELGVEIEP